MGIGDIFKIKQFKTEIEQLKTENQNLLNDNQNMHQQLQELGAFDYYKILVSPSSQRMDYLTKLFKYRTAGVREYWIVNPMTRIVQVYCFGEPEDSTQYSFDEEISVGIYNDLKICIADLLK